MSHTDPRIDHTLATPVILTIESTQWDVQELSIGAEVIQTEIVEFVMNNHRGSLN